MTAVAAVTGVATMPTVAATTRFMSPGSTTVTWPAGSARPRGHPATGSTGAGPTGVTRATGVYPGHRATGGPEDRRWPLDDRRSVGMLFGGTTTLPWQAFQSQLLPHDGSQKSPGHQFGPGCA